LVHRINRVSVSVATWYWLAAIFDLAQPIMAWFACAGKIALVERQVAAAAVRDRVIHNSRRDYPAHCGAIPAKRLVPELL
jgi:hypothetical protein